MRSRDNSAAWNGLLEAIRQDDLDLAYFIAKKYGFTSTDAEITKELKDNSDISAPAKETWRYVYYWEQPCGKTGVNSSPMIVAKETGIGLSSLRNRFTKDVFYFEVFINKEGPTKFWRTKHLPKARQYD